MKKTQKEYFEEIKVALEGAGAEQEYIDFIDAELAKLADRAEKAKAKRAEKKAEGDDLKDAVLAEINAVEGAITAQEIADKLIEDYPEVTKAKVVYRANQLVKDGDVFKVKVDKLVAYTADEPAEDAE